MILSFSLLIVYGCSVFVMDTTSALPDALVALIRLLLSSPEEWNKCRDKGKPPKPKSDLQTDQIAIKVLNKRLSMYPTFIEVSFHLR